MAEPEQSSGVRPLAPSAQPVRPDPGVDAGGRALAGSEQPAV